MEGVKESTTTTTTEATVAEEIVSGDETTSDAGVTPSLVVTDVVDDSVPSIAIKDESTIPTTTPSDNEGSIITFRGVETGQATLSVEAMDADIPLGSSTAYDLAPYTSQLLDAMDRDSETYTMEMPVAILPSTTSDSGTHDDTVPAAEAVCTVTLKLEYQPSAKDKREELYELLNKASEKKSVAVEKLRQSAMAAARARATSSGGADSSSSSVVTKPAVKPGFLNKKQNDKPKEVSRIVTFYENNLGPNSPLRRYLPVAKNYIIFFGFLAFSHFKGHLLALPQPV
jgi:hypothetical protein